MLHRKHHDGLTPGEDDILERMAAAEGRSSDRLLPAEESADHHVLDISTLKPALLRGVLLLLETVIVPTMLLYFCRSAFGDLWGLVAVLGWCALTVGTRMTMRRRVPSTLLLAVGSLAGRTTAALLFSNVYVYLLQPVAGSLFMAALFLGSAAVGRPLTARLAQDFVALPAHLLGDRRVRRLFVNVSLVWGSSRLLDAAMSLASIHVGVGAGLLSRGLLSTVLTVATVVGCSLWGWRRIRQVPGMRVQFA